MTGNTEPSAPMADEQGAIPEARKLIASMLCDEVRAYRHAQDAATTDRDKLYRMGQKDAMILIARQIDDVLAAAPAADRLADTGEAEALGPLWRKVQQVHRDAMSNDWSVTDYRAGMAATLGIATPQPVDAGVMREAAKRVLAWAGPIAGDNHDEEAAAEEEASVAALLNAIRNLPDAGEPL